MNCSRLRIRADLISTLVLILTSSGLAAEKAAPLSTFGKLPIKEITVFKDGNAFVAHEGEMPVDKSGNVVMDYLPAPVLGTFWPYSADPAAKLTSVTAGQKRVLIERTALTLRELLEANMGAEVFISEGGTNRYLATVLDLPRRSAEEFATTNPPNSPERLPEPGNLVLLQTESGVKALSLDRIQELTFKNKPKPTTAVPNPPVDAAHSSHVAWYQTALSETTGPASPPQNPTYEFARVDRWATDAAGNTQVTAHQYGFQGSPKTQRVNHAGTSANRRNPTGTNCHRCGRQNVSAAEARHRYRRGTVPIRVLFKRIKT